MDDITDYLSAAGERLVELQFDLEMGVVRADSELATLLICIGALLEEAAVTHAAIEEGLLSTARSSPPPDARDGWSAAATADHPVTRRSTSPTLHGRTGVPSMTTTHGTGAQRALNMLAGLGLTIGSLAACGLSEITHGDTDWMATCPDDAKLATSVNLDASGSSTTGELSDQDIAILRDAASRTAACRGHLRVSAFAGSSAGTTELFDSELHLKGATDTARLRRIPALADDVVEQVGGGYRSLPQMTGGTDVVGQLRGDREYVEQLGDDYQLWSITGTDGFQTAGVRFKQLGNSEAAQREAESLPVADFSGLDAEVLFVGIGTTAKKVAPPTAVVDAVKAFYATICDRLSARRCQVATNYTRIGG